MGNVKEPQDGQKEEEEREEGILVRFPTDATRMPEPFLPGPLGRVDSSHPLRRPLLIAIIVLFILLFAQITITLISESRKSANVKSSSLSESYREEGTINYQGKALKGWFLEPERQHFMAEDGRKFTYVNPHKRGDTYVPGYWRLVE